MGVAVTDEVLTQLASSTGPLGTLILVLAVWIRGQLREVTLRLDATERRIIHLEERSTDGQ